MESEGDVAIAIGGAGRDGAEVGLTFPVAGNVTRIAGVEVDLEDFAIPGVKSAFNRPGAAGHQCRSNDWEILETVRAAIRILGIVRSDAVGSQVDPKMRSRGSI